MKQAKVLIVEDQFIEARNLRTILRNAGYEVLPITRSYTEALTCIDKEVPDIVLIDIYLQGKLTGIDLAYVLQKKKIAFVYLSANSEKNILEEAKLTRPYGFLVKPFRTKDVLVMLDIACYLHQEQATLTEMKDQTDRAPAGPGAPEEFPGFVGESEKIRELTRNVKIVAPADTVVLILGESGTGKELIANMVHRLSPRRSKPFVVVNCATLPADLIESELFGHEKGAFTGAFEKRTGKFELADNGTIFLDEIGELPPDLQVKFLRVLQEQEIEPIAGKRKKINVRVIAATNRNLEDEISAGRFRIDLYYRINIFPIHLPPLRERIDDIPLLADHFIDYYAAKQKKDVKGVSKEVLKSLKAYSWPGNVRELENVIEKNVLLTASGKITSLTLPVQKTAPAEPTGSLKTIHENEREHIMKALEKCGYKIYGRGGAAELLDINGSTLRSRMKKLGIEKLFMTGPPNTNPAK